MSTSTVQQRTEQGIATAATMTTPELISGMRALTDPADESERVTRAWIVEALERRYPGAAAAVGRAFEYYDERLANGGDVDAIDEPDYVEVLIEHIPAGDRS